MNRALGELYPDAHCELDFTTPLELLVATILSAQTTDKRVNQVTPTVFARYPDAAAYASADREELEAIIKSTGFFRAKTNSIIGLGQALCDNYDGEVPGKLKDLVTLPGVGRKTANVVLGNAFGVPGITVDTHFGRLARRFGWTAADRPRQSRSRGRRTVPTQGLDDAFASPDLAWTTALSLSPTGMWRMSPLRGGARPMGRGPRMPRRRKSWSRIPRDELGLCFPMSEHPLAPPWLHPLLSAVEEVTVHDLTRFAPPAQRQAGIRLC